jgi:hypothetical protein
VIETYLEGPGGAPKKRRKILQSLQGSWVNASSTMAGIKFVEKCYDLAEAAEKEMITAELAASEDRVGATSRGAMLLQRCNVDAFKRGGKDWQQRVVATQEVRKEFEELFGDGGAAAAGDEDNDEEELEEEKEPVEQSKKSDKKADKKEKKRKSSGDADEEELKKKSSKNKKEKKEKKKKDV